MNRIGWKYIASIIRRRIETRERKRDRETKKKLSSELEWFMNQKADKCILTEKKSLISVENFSGISF